MSLKTPIFLILIVGSLWLCIFFIWPDIKKISGKNQEISNGQELVNSIKEKNANINNLIASLESEQNLSQKEFVFGYIPMEKKEELIFDSLNRIANSEGVNVSLGNVSLDFKKSVLPKTVSEMPQSSQEVIFKSATGVDGMPVSASVLPAEEVVKANVSIFGKYENVKKFIEKLYTLNMLKDIASVSLTSTKNSAGGATDNINGTLTVNFSFIPEAKINNDYSDPIFGKKSFNFAIVDQAREKLSQIFSDIVVAEGSSAGRSNPFLP